MWVSILTIWIFFISLQERVNKGNNNEKIYVLIAITVFHLIIIVNYLTQYQG